MEPNNSPLLDSKSKGLSKAFKFIDNLRASLKGKYRNSNDDNGEETNCGQARPWPHKSNGLTNRPMSSIDFPGRVAARRGQDELAPLATTHTMVSLQQQSRDMRRQSLKSVGKSTELPYTCDLCAEDSSKNFSLTRARAVLRRKPSFKCLSNRPCRRRTQAALLQEQTHHRAANAVQHSSLERTDAKALFHTLEELDAPGLIRIVPLHSPPSRPLPSPSKRNSMPPLQSAASWQSPTIPRRQSTHIQLPSQRDSMNTNVNHKPEPKPELELGQETKPKLFMSSILRQQPLPPPDKPLPHLPADARIPSWALRSIHRNLSLRRETSDKIAAQCDQIDAEIKYPVPKLPENANPITERVSSVASARSTLQTTENSVDIRTADTKTADRSVKSKRPSLRNKISALFGDATTSPTVETGDTMLSPSTYRPISLLSHESDGFFFADVLDDIRKAASSPDHAPHNPAAPPERMPLVETSIQSLENSLLESRAVSRDQRTSAASAASQRNTGRLLSRWSQVSTTDASDGPSPSASKHTKHSSYGNLGSNDIDKSLPPAPRRPGGMLNNHTAAYSAGSPEAPVNKSATIASAPSSVEQPPVVSDPPLQSQKDLFNDAALEDSSMARPPSETGTLSSIEDFCFNPLHISRRRPKQTAIVTRNAPHPAGTSAAPLLGSTTRNLTLVSEASRGNQEDVDVDPEPAFDRTVDVTWYRGTTRDSENVRTGAIPRVPNRFHHVSMIFKMRYSQGRPTERFDELKRFRYFELGANIRYRIMDKLLEDYRPGKPVLLNKKSHALPAWPYDFFATLWDILGPLQSYLWACPHLRADLMAALLSTQPFHVIFSPYTKPSTQPLVTKWFLEYAYFMQDVRIELDMTKLGFGLEWETTAMGLQLSAISSLVDKFVSQALNRCPRRNPLTSLTIFCRRYFGYRQGVNPLAGDKLFYMANQAHDGDAGDENLPFMRGQPRAFGCKTASLPPSANNPRSGHRRHHAYARDRVPFVREAHMSVADGFGKLVGRVWIVRMVGFSEKWTFEAHQKFWPKGEFDALSNEQKAFHVDRYTPSRHTEVAPGHALYLDYGIRAGIHRYPPLPDSEPMVCTGYDATNDLFIEIGSGNILTALEGSVEMISRAHNPPILRSDLPVPGGPPVPLDSLRVRPSKIPRPMAGVDSLSMQAMRHGTPIKALRLLGVPYNGQLSSMPLTPAGEPTKEGSVLTPTKTRSVRFKAPPARNAGSHNAGVEPNELAEASPEPVVETPSRASKPRVLSAKKSLLALIGSDRQKHIK